MDNDIINSRDVINRIEELEGIGDRDDEKQIELDMLRDFAAKAEGCCENWGRGATLIRDSYFKHYAQELAEDIHGANSWPLLFVDWDRVARHLQMDYTAIEFDGTTYWVR